MNVHFIDTSVLLNILDVPDKNQNRVEVMKEYKTLKGSKVDWLIIPLATIIETGNHIAKMKQGGDLRRQKAQQLAELIRAMINEVIPFKYYGRELDEKDLTELSEMFPNFAMRGTGFGDLSIIRAYEEYIKNTPGIGKIRIWSMDDHLSCYKQELTMPSKRKRI